MIVAKLVGIFCIVGFALYSAECDEWIKLVDSVYWAQKVARINFVPFQGLAPLIPVPDDHCRVMAAEEVEQLSYLV